MVYETGMVAFVDILGTRSVKDFETKYLLHSVWHTEAHNVEAREQNNKSRTLIRKTYSFSDCAYFTYKFKDEIEEERRKPERLFEALTTLVVPIQLIMQLGFLVRGGIVYDKFFADHLGLFGPAVEESYILECEKAVYPRIILEKEFGTLMHDLQVDPGFQRLIYRDDDFFYLNPFYNIASFNAIGATPFSKESFFSQLRGNACNVINGNAPDRVKEKWGWMDQKIVNEIAAIDQHDEAMIQAFYFAYNNK